VIFQTGFAGCYLSNPVHPVHPVKLCAASGIRRDIRRFGLDPSAAWNNLTVMNIEPDHLPVWLTLLIPVIILLALWDGVWKVIGMWKSARNKQLAWFICIAVFNTIGILPIIYLALCQKDRNER
jgi:hypothetical protein